MLIVFPAVAWAQPCTTSNGTGCLCPDGTTNCDLLPDLTISWHALATYAGGPVEYSQTGNGADNGRLRLTGATPNIGYGSFTVRGTNYFICGQDTINDPTRTIVTCPDGSYPKNLLQQRIYHKNGNTITYYDRWAGGQTYHPTHGHNHVDDWVRFTLREEDPNQHDTLQWPIVGSGAKLGFCLMDLSNCGSSYGDCRDDQTKYGQGNILAPSLNNLPNYGFGGGSYSCSPVEQGISVGYEDIYSYNLDGMWIDIPPGTCNGNYWIVAEVDPLNNFLESNEHNNWTAIPFTLTKQNPIGQSVATITVNGPTELCNGQTVTLIASTATTYHWSTGETGDTIMVADTGLYFVQTTSQCGMAISDTVHISQVTSNILSTGNDTSCLHSSATLTATGTSTVRWYDSPTTGNLVATGDSLFIPDLTTTTTYYAENRFLSPSAASHVGETSTQYMYADTFYAGGYQEFSVVSDIVLSSVLVHSFKAGIRTIQLRNEFGVVLDSVTTFIDTGAVRVNLNFQVPIGSGYQLATSQYQNRVSFNSNSPYLSYSFVASSHYPYGVANAMTMYLSSSGPTFYFYFYDWEIYVASGECLSPREAVTAVATTPPTVSITGLGATYQLTSNDVPIVGQPAGGTFSGDGVLQGANNSFVFQPSSLDTGTFHVIYTYNDPNGCGTVADTQTVRILADTSTNTGIADLNSHLSVQLFPNPANSRVNVQLVSAQATDAHILVYNAIGALVNDQQIDINKGINHHQLDISTLPSGIYLVEVHTPFGYQVIKLEKRQ